MAKAIRLEHDKHVARIILNRPELYNAFNRQMALELINALKSCNENSEIRIIYLSGEGKAFCSGQDLKEVTDPQQNIGFERIVDEHYNTIIRTILQLNKPVIAGVNGVAAGAGANIAFACDIVLAKTTAKFIQAFSKIGLIPDSGGTFILPRLIGFHRAKALCMTGDAISANEAQNIGLVYRVFEDDKFEEQCSVFCQKLSELPPLGLSYTKKLFLSSMDNDLDKQLENEKELQVKAGSTSDYKECVDAFLEKRKPVIKGE